MDIQKANVGDLVRLDFPGLYGVVDRIYPGRPSSREKNYEGIYENGGLVVRTSWDNQTKPVKQTNYERGSGLCGTEVVHLVSDPEQEIARLNKTDLAKSSQGSIDALHLGERLGRSIDFIKAYIAEKNSGTLETLGERTQQRFSGQWESNVMAAWERTRSAKRELTGWKG